MIAKILIAAAFIAGASAQATAPQWGQVSFLCLAVARIALIEVFTHSAVVKVGRVPQPARLDGLASSVTRGTAKWVLFCLESCYCSKY